MNTTKLMEMYKGTFQPALAEGIYKVKLLSHEYVENTNDSTKDYIKVDMEVVEGASKGRKINENRFTAGFPVMISHLRQQLNREDEAVEPIKFFNELIENETPFDIWVVKRVVKGSPKTNIHFLEPIKEETPNITVTED